jgi:hypothetical protein
VRATRGAQAGPYAKLHLELLVGLQVQHKGACSGDLQDASPAGSERLCDETDATMTAAAVKQLKRRLVDSVEKRVDEAGGKPRLSFKIQINHNVPCWLMTLLLLQFFGGRNLQHLDE